MIFEWRIEGGHVSRKLFLSRGEDIPAGAKFDSIMTLGYWDQTPLQEAHDWQKTFAPLCDVCRVLTADEPPHPEWKKFGT
jgi:hypothetical protein